MKRQITRTGKLLGGYVPATVVAGIQRWVAQGDERDVSTFLREAAREKLRREGILEIKAETDAVLAECSKSLKR